MAPLTEQFSMEHETTMGKASRRKKLRLSAPDVLGDVRNMRPQERVVYVDVASRRTRQVALDVQGGEQLAQAFENLLRYVVQPNSLFQGGCHNLSAVLYMRLKQLGFESAKLLLGEVHCPAGKFDHSWVELDGKVYDVAICAPCSASVGRREGCFTGGPVFAGVDVGSNRPSQAQFGVASDLPLGEDAAEVLQHSMIDYLALQRVRGWISMADILSKVYGVDGVDLVTQHHDAKRQWRNSAQNHLAL